MRSVIALSVVVFGLMLLWGGGCLSYSMNHTIRLDAQSREWPTADGTIVLAELSPRPGAPPDSWGDLRFRYTYSVAGTAYEGERISLFGTKGVYGSPREMQEAIVAKYPPGRQVKVYYDPEDPRAALLEPGGYSGSGGSVRFGLGVAVAGGVVTLTGGLLWRDTQRRKRRERPPQPKGAGQSRRMPTGTKARVAQEATAGIRFRKAKQGLGCAGYLVSVPLFLVVGTLAFGTLFGIECTGPTSARASSDGHDFAQAFKLSLGLIVAATVLYLAAQIRAYRKWFYPLQRERGPLAEKLARKLGLEHQEILPPAALTRLRHSAPGGNCVYDVWRSVRGFPFNIASGAYKGHRLHLFDHHDAVFSIGVGSFTNPASIRWEKSPLDFTVIAFEQQRLLPALVIIPEELWDKTAKRLGGIDIDLESVEFSDQYRVFSKDRRFAYAVCQGLVMTFLLQHPHVSLKTEGNVLAFRFPGLAPIGELWECVHQLVAIPSLVPQYLLEENTAP